MTPAIAHATVRRVLGKKEVPPSSRRRAAADPVGGARHWLFVRLGSAAIVVLTFMALGIGPAWAHAYLADSAPRAGQTLSAAPEQVTLTFTEVIQSGSAKVAVRGADGRLVTAEPATVIEAVVQQSVAIRASGPYQVAYTVVGADGHPVAGHLSFTYASAATAGEATPAASPGSLTADNSATPEKNRVSSALWWAFGIAVTVVALLGIAFLRMGVRRLGANG